MLETSRHLRSKCHGDIGRTGIVLKTKFSESYLQAFSLHNSQYICARPLSSMIRTIVPFR